MMQELFDEFSQWYLELIEQQGLIPRAVSGVSSSGQQFIFILDGLRMDHVERNKLIKAALAAEGAKFFAYGSLMGGYDEATDQIEEELSIYAGTAEKFIGGKWFVGRNENGLPTIKHIRTINGDDPQEYPTTWFLTRSNALSQEDEQRYGEIWKSLREDAQFMQRREGG
jgi:hypothetical protein